MKKNLVLTLAGMSLLCTSALAETKKYDAEIAKLQKQLSSLQKEVNSEKKARESFELAKAKDSFKSDLLKVSMKMDLETSKHYRDRTGRGFASAVQAAQLTLKGRLAPEWGYKMRVDFAAEDFDTSKGGELYDNGPAVQNLVSLLKNGRDAATAIEKQQVTENTIMNGTNITYGQLSEAYQNSVAAGVNLTEDGTGLALDDIETMKINRKTDLKDARIEFYGLYPFIFAAGRFTPDLSPDHDDQFLELPAFSAIVPFEKNQIYGSYRNNGFYVSTSMAFSNMTSTSPKKDTRKVWYSRIAYAPYYNDQDVILFGINSAISKSDPKGKVMGFNQRPENTLGSILVGAGTLNNVKSSSTYIADLSLRKGPLSFQSAYGTTKISRSNNLKNSKIHGGYAQISYSLTGEIRAFDPDFPGFANIKAAKPFDLRNGHFGAFEAKYRYSYLNFGKSAYNKLGGVSLNGSNGMLVTALTGVEAEANGSYLLNGGKMTINTVGINWYTNDYLTFMLDYSLVSVKNSQIWGAIYKIKQSQANGMPAANHKPRIVTLRASVKI